MSINIVCPGCKKRFSVDDKHAGKKGPCPKCKTVLEIPAIEEEIVIHGPEESLPKDSKGRSVIDPIMREETTVSTKGIVGICVFVVVVFGIAFGLRAYEELPFLFKLLGAVSLAPPLVLSGYTFLRNDELEAYRGKELAIRVLVCSAVYAALWGLFAFIPAVLGIEFTPYQLAFVTIPFVLVGGFAAFASFDLEYLTGVMHYGLYVIVTVLMRVVAGLDAF
jgi:cation transport ATPase